MRLRTRLTITMTTFTAATVLVMAFILLLYGFSRISRSYYERGLMLNRLAQTSIEYGLRLPERAMAVAGSQMIVSALITAELIPLAENDAKMTPDEIGALLKRVMDRSVEYNGTPLIEEFWITDESGRAYIRTEKGVEFSFPPEGTPGSQSAPFSALLKPDAKPIFQSLRARDYDGRSFSYAAVPGVDKPRIVQLGVSAAYFDSLLQHFRPEEIMTRFVDDSAVTHIALVNENGEIEAQAVDPRFQGTPMQETEIVAQCTRFLRQYALSKASQNFSVEQYVDMRGRIGVGVVTPIVTPGADRPRALFVHHQTDEMIEVLRETSLTILITAVALILLAVLVALWLGQRLTRPISALMEAVDRFSQGDFAHRIHLKGDAEISSLAETLNKMATSIEHYTAQLQRESRRIERLESDLRIGAEIQRSLLPESPPQIPGFAFAAFSEPAREVGGDFYDFLRRGNGIDLALGDASGKGLPAALLVTECSSALRVQRSAPDALGERLERVNRALHTRIAHTGNFITLFLAHIDPETRTLYYAVAGHNPALLQRAKGGIEGLHGRGLPLGVAPECVYETRRVEVFPGDTLVCYSDGVTDAQNKEQQLYGEDRLIALLDRERDAAPEELIEAIRKDVAQFRGSARISDDMTVVVVRVLPETATQYAI